MRFNIYEYQDELEYNTSTENIIVEDTYIFIHEEKYSEKFPNKFKDDQGNEQNTEYPKQLKNQVFILINKSNKYIYAYEASLKQTQQLIHHYTKIDLNIYLRFEGGIDGFIDKLKNLRKIIIKGDGDLKLPILRELLKKDSDLSNYENIEVELSYRQQNDHWFTKNKYNELIKYDIYSLKLEGESEDSIISFDNKKVIEHIDLIIERNKNNIYDKNQVFSCLKNKLQ